MRLIDADALKEYFFRPYSNEEVYSNIDIEEIIDAQPTFEQQGWIPCSERLPRYNEKVLVKHTHFVNVDTAFLCHTHLWDYWRFDHVIPKEPFVDKRDMWIPVPLWKNTKDEGEER